jgi:hypothetical protein
MSPILTRTALLVAASLWPAAALAQNAPAGNRPSQPVGVDLARDTFRIESVGLAMRLPEGALAQTTQMGDQLGVQVTPPPPDSSWLISVQTPVSQNHQLTASKVAEEVLNQLLGSVGVVNRSVRDGLVVEHVVSTSGVVLSPVKAFEIASAEPEHRREGAHFYVKLPRGEKETPLIRGYTIFKVAPGKFVTFDLSTTEPQLDSARRIYEVVLGTVRFTDPSILAASRGAAVESGIDLLTRLTSAHYEAAIASLKDQYYRLYKPAPGGSDIDATEVAYRRVRAWKGMRGEIDPLATPASLKGSERQIGYLVRIDARHLQGPRTIDSVGIYFMTADRHEESWNLQMVIRDPDQRKPAVWREAGARDGLSMNVTVSGTGIKDQVWRPVVPESGYITMVESFLLPSLLINAKAPAGQRGFYTYQSKANKIRLRTDLLAEVADRAGAWKITTRANEDEEPQSGLYNERGDLIQISFTDGSVMVPTTLTRLSELWRAKNLPMN